MARSGSGRPGDGRFPPPTWGRERVGGLAGPDRAPPAPRGAGRPRSACGAVAAAAAALLIGAGAAGAACRKAFDPDLAGLYTLEGVMEVGSQFILYTDGRFEYMLAYGAIDQYGRGCWTTEREGRVDLIPNGRNRVPDMALPSDRRFRGLSLRRARDGDLIWALPGEEASYSRDGG